MPGPPSTLSRWKWRLSPGFLILAQLLRRKRKLFRARIFSIIELAQDVGAEAESVEQGEVTEELRNEFEADKDDMEYDGAPEEDVHDLLDGGDVT
jgi:hypothetical protein